MDISKDLRTEYEEIIEHVSELMRDNVGNWSERYREYLEVLNPQSVEYKRIKRLKNMYKISRPITRYLSISYTKKARTAVVYDLRVYGHSIGKLIVKLDDKVKAILDADVFDKKELKKIRDNITYVVFDKKNSKSLKKIVEILDEDKSIQNKLEGWIDKNIDEKIKNGIGIDKKQSTVEYAWNSNEMKSLRSILKLGEANLKLESEHACENLLLKELSKKDGTRKYIKDIQPITICDTGFFQLSTCLKGSDAKKGINDIKYAKQYGGGIDILARISKGNKSELCVIELKDKYENSESPIKAMKQAITYAVFLEHLIREEKANGENVSWYKDVFLNKKQPKDKIRINVVVAMPYANGVGSRKQISEEDKSLANVKLPINNNGYSDELVLHYLFFKPEALQQDGIEEGIVTSLFDK